MGGSKDNNKTTRAAVLIKTIHKKAPPMKSSIFTAEVCAIDVALNIISRDKHHKFFIISESLSVLISLRKKKLESPLIVNLLSRQDAMSSQKEIIMCWIPSHIGVSGNDRADSAAKSAIDLNPDNIFILYTNLKHQINRFFLTKWQQRWNSDINNKLFQIKPTLGEWRPAFRKSRKEQDIISRLRTGHANLTKSFIFKLEQSSECLTCQTPYIIQHVLLECEALAITRERYLKTDNMRDMFENVHMHDVLSFLRNTGLYLKI